MAATILSHNFTTIVTALFHSLAIAKVLSVKSSRISLLTSNHLKINHLSSCFSFFCPHPKRGGKKKNNGRTDSGLNYPGIIQTSITTHSPKMYCYAFGKTYYCLLAVAGIVQESIIYLTGMRIFTIPCPGSLD